MDSLERVLKASSVFKVAVEGASCVMLKDEIPTRESPSVDEVPVEASLVEATNVPPPRARWAGLGVDMLGGPLIGWCLAHMLS